MQDIDGQQVNVGDRVEAASTSASPSPLVPAGAQGTVIVIPDDGNIGVRWDDYDAGHHDLDHRCTQGHGYYVHPATVRVVTSQTVPDFSSQRGWLKEAIGETGDAYIRLDGEVYKLEKTAVKVEDTMARMEQEAAKIIRQYQTRYEQMERSLKDQLANACTMPDIDASTLAKYDLRICKMAKTNIIQYIFPFHYKLQFLFDRDTGEKFRLSEAKQARCDHQLFMAINMQMGKYYYTELYKELDDIRRNDAFDHYHSGCFGTMQIPPMESIEQMASFRDAVESMLTTANAGDMSHSAPDGLPQSRTLKTGAALIDDEEAGMFSESTTFRATETTETAAGLKAEQEGVFMS